MQPALPGGCSIRLLQFHRPRTEAILPGNDVFTRKRFYLAATVRAARPHGCCVIDGRRWFLRCTTVAHNDG